MTNRATSAFIRRNSVSFHSGPVSASGWRASATVPLHCFSLPITKRTHPSAAGSTQ